MTVLVKTVVQKRIEHLESIKKTTEIARLTKQRTKLTKKINSLKEIDAEIQTKIDDLTAWAQLQP